jgi:hypothetical protein
MELLQFFSVWDRRTFNSAAEDIQYPMLSDGSSLSIYRWNSMLPRIDVLSNATQRLMENY